MHLKALEYLNLTEWLEKINNNDVLPPLNPPCNVVTIGGFEGNAETEMSIVNRKNYRIIKDMWDMKFGEG